MTPEFEARAAEINEVRKLSNCHVKVMRIIEQVAYATGFKVVDILAEDRKPAVSQARDLAMFEARALGISFPELGRSFDRDHSTVVAAVKREQARREAQ